MAKGADPYFQNDYGMTALHKAAYYGRKSVVNFLLEQGMDINLNTTATPLISATDGNHVDMVKFLHKKGANPTLLNKSNLTPLQTAAMRGNIKLAKMFLSEGIDINHNVSQSPLVTAAANNQYKMAKFLLENGADPNLKNIHGKSALSFAVHHNNQKMMDLIQEYGGEY